VSAAEVGKNPTSVDVHPEGDLIAVATGQPGEQLVVVPVARDGSFGKALSWELLGIDDRAAVASSVAWSPNGRYVAVVLPMRDEVVFYEFTRTLNNGGMGFARYGAPVKVGKHPFMGRFSPDGRHFIVNELHWGDQVEGYLVGAPAGSLSVIRLSSVPSQVIVPEGAPEPKVEHAVVSTAGVGVSPEGLAMSPDGNWVVTANLRRSMLPTGDARLTPGGSVSLLSFDPGTGQLTSRGEYEIGAMPEGITFDAAGRNVVVTQFRSFDPNSVDGELAFFKLVPGENARLVPGDFYVGVGVGPHGVVIVR
ncbi:MAG: beta-propeller fold lactonase family protein, partial [Phycisphaerae bacterium]|nr:beta-propeller fold lactonase family protein [Phycisphaerae bacterium]